MNYLFINIVKIVAAFFVSWGHLVTSGTFDTNLRDADLLNLSEPLLPAAEHLLWKPDMFLIQKFGVPCAAVGVTIFFLVSGFLTPRMQSKYITEEKPLGLLYSRLSKIYPCTVVCTVAIGLLFYVLHGTVFQLRDYIDTAFLTSNWNPGAGITGLVWYLLVLVMFYIIATVVPKFTLNNITYIYLALYLLILGQKCTVELHFAPELSNLVWCAKFCSIPLLGAAAYLLKDKSLGTKIILFAWYFYLNLGVLKFDSYVNGTAHAYSDANVYFFAFAVILIGWLLGKFLTGRKAVEKFCAEANKILLTFYLVHFSFGFNTIDMLKKLNIYICIFAAYIVAILVAKFLTICADILSKCIGRMVGFLGQFRKKYKRSD